MLLNVWPAPVFVVFFISLCFFRLLKNISTDASTHFHAGGPLIIVSQDSRWRRRHQNTRDIHTSHRSHRKKKKKNKKKTTVSKMFMIQKILKASNADDSNGVDSREDREKRKAGEKKTTSRLFIPPPHPSPSNPPSTTTGSAHPL